MVAGLPGQHGKISPHQNLSIYLRHEADYATIVGPWIEAGVQAAVGVQSTKMVARLPAQFSKPASYQDFSIPLHCQATHDVFRPRIEGAVQGAVRVQSADIGARLAAQLGEIATDQDLSIQLDGEAKDRTNEGRAIATCSRIESAIETAVHIEPGNETAGRAGHVREIPADDDFAV